jgi:phosphoglycerate dehydrogenase-like enzyme
VDRKRVVMVFPLPDEAGESILAEAVDVLRPETTDEHGIAAVLSGAHGIIIASPGRMTPALFAAGPMLEVVATPGSGFDHIDVGAATRRSVPVLNGTGVAPNAVAEYVIGAMISAHRGFPDRHQALASDRLDWSTRMAQHVGTELTGTTVGIVGYGAIGKRVAQLVALTFDARVLVYDPFVDPSLVAPPATAVADLTTLLKQSSTVTIHVPLSDETRGLIGRAELRLIGSDGVLIDAARGGIVDESALVESLHGGALKAAVIDVFEPEPPTHAQLTVLANTPNLLMTPHIAGVTDQALRALSSNIATSVVSVLRGDRVRNIVNPEAWVG